MNQTRRVIYVNDTEWASWKDLARKAGVSTSELIRQRMTGGIHHEPEQPDPDWKVPARPKPRSGGPSVAVAEPEDLDIDLTKLRAPTVQQMGGGFNTRPFTPVPKKGK